MEQDEEVIFTISKGCNHKSNQAFTTQKLKKK